MAEVDRPPQASQEVLPRTHIVPTDVNREGSASTIEPTDPDSSRSAEFRTERPNVEMLWKTITTRDGRGADVMVQNGSSQRHGLEPTIGIATRSQIETNHSYLRFDLAEVEQVRRHVQAAGIVLTLVGGREGLIESVVRVRGIVNVPLWPEQALGWRNSFSAKGLDSFPLLGETTIMADNLWREGEVVEVRITGPEFAKFIADSSTDTVTMVLSGSGPGSALLRFVSRENPVDRPPKLLLQVPRNPLPESKQKLRGQPGS